MSPRAFIPIVSTVSAVVMILSTELTGQASSPGSVSDDIFFLDLGIVIEPGTGDEEVNRVVEAPPEKVKFFLDKEPSGSVYMASTRKMQETLNRISDRLDALETAFHQEMTSVRGENRELREMISDLLAREPILPARPADPAVPLTSEAPEVVEVIPEPGAGEEASVVVPQPERTFSRVGYMNAVFAYQREDYRAALDHFSRLYLQDRDDMTWGNVLYWIADCHYQLGDYRKALDALEKIRPLIRSDKRDDALVLAGLAYRRIGQEGRALEAFDHIVQDFPDSEYFKLARMELRKSRE